jgi:hypothetical protein
MEVANEQLRCGVVFLETVNTERLERIPSIAEMEVEHLQEFAIAVGELLFELIEKGKERGKEV